MEKDMESGVGKVDGENIENKKVRRTKSEQQCCMFHDLDWWYSAFWLCRLDEWSRVSPHTEWSPVHQNPALGPGTGTTSSLPCTPGLGPKGLGTVTPAGWDWTLGVWYHTFRLGLGPRGLALPAMCWDQALGPSIACA